MKGAFYPKLAMTSIRNNKRLYLPYILTCIGIIMTYYIISFLVHSTVVSQRVAGGAALQGILNFGGWVIVVFAVLFLFYTNSFLTKRRKKEFGLYNILGMNKKNISRILFWETIIISAISLIAGLFLGVLFSKMAELCLLNLIGEKISMNFEISVTAMIYSVVIFMGINVLLLINNIIQVGKNKAIDLLHSEAAGEKKLKGNAVFAILGAVILGTAYYIAVTIGNPIDAMSWFFVAVIMVIVASYMLFISGSVFICKLLKKNKKYYYKPNHFVSVSSMAYRMKRHGAGLASICILATMVLVMISTTFSLYVGTEDALLSRYPREYNYYKNGENKENFIEKYVNRERERLYGELKEENVEIKNVTDLCTGNTYAMLMEGILEADRDKASARGDVNDTSKLYGISFVTLDQVNNSLKEAKSLEPGEVLLYDSKNAYPLDELKFNDFNLKIKERLKEFPVSGEESMELVNTITVVVRDFEELKPLLGQKDKNGNSMLTMGWRFEFDLADYTPANAKAADKAVKAFKEGSEEGSLEKKTGNWYIREENRKEFFDTYSGLFFIGIMLSIVFTIAAVLIIYYKQITEGYEDQARFDIMQKVGMTKKEIKKSVNSQLLIVFFLPLIGAASHLCFAFPMINKILQIFSLYNTALFAASCGVCFLVFAALYVVIYKMTSNAYLAIVSK